MSKTIVEKLNLNKYAAAAVLNQPQGEDDLVDLRGYDTELKQKAYDLIFAYVFDLESLQKLVALVIDRQALNDGGYLYAAYPKKGNKVYETYVHRDSLLEGLGADADGYIGQSSIKFARMVGLNDIFTVVGLKAEARKKAASASKKPSQAVGDYIDRIPDVERDLAGHPEELVFYRSLTPGYQRDWARHVYSAVQEDTRAKRRGEMIEALRAGFKSWDLYRRANSAQ